jgi:hypothetical protein
MLAFEEMRQFVVAWLVLLSIVLGLVVIAVTNRKHPQNLAFVGGLVLIVTGILFALMILPDSREIEFQDLALPLAFVLIGILAVMSARKPKTK